MASQAFSAGQLDREKASRKRAEKLEARLPRLVINVPEPSRAPGLEIRRGGVVIGAPQWGAPLPVDPGEIEIVASATGKQTLKQTLRLEEGKTASFDLPALVDEGAPAAAPAPAPAPAATAEDDEEQETEDEGAASEDESKKAGGASKGLVYTLAAAGILGLGVGTGFAMMARSTNEESKKHCDPQNPNLCSADGVKMRNDAMSEGNIATAGFVVGGVALATAGIVLLVSGGISDNAKEKQSRRLRPSAALGPRQGVVYVQGSF